MTAQEKLDKLILAGRRWQRETEARLRLLDSRGEAAKSMLGPDRDLIAALDRAEVDKAQRIQ